MRGHLSKTFVPPIVALFFLSAAPQKTKIKVAPLPHTPGETSTEKSSDNLYRDGLKAESTFDYVNAAKFYAASAEKNPDRPKIWDSVGFAYEMCRQFDQAVVAYQHAIEKDPQEQYAYKHLAGIYELRGQYDSAIEEYKRQLQMNPRDTESHQGLADIYMKQRKFDLAQTEFEAATKNIIKAGASLDEQRGIIQLGLHQDGEALASFRTALQHETDPMATGTIALALADDGVHLDVADQLATLALRYAVAQSNRTSLKTINYDSARSTGLLAVAWDTVGWIRFAQGDLKAAESYTRASWAIDNENSLTAFHLAEIYAKEGRRADAIHAYALSLSCDQPPPQARQSLKRLLGDGDIDSVVAAAKTERLNPAAVPLSNPKHYEGIADFWLLLSPTEHGAGSRVIDVEPIPGRDENRLLRKYSNELRSLSLPYSFPVGEQAKLFVRGALSYSTANPSCEFKPYTLRQTLDILLANTRLQLPKGFQITMHPN